MDRQLRSAVAEMKDSEVTTVFNRSTVAMVLTDPRLDDNPIVYVNEAFERMTGYARDSAIGRNCRFLQCEQTDPADVAAMRRAIEAGEEVGIDLLNCRSDGSSFVNRLLISPIRDANGEITHFLGIQKALSDNERQHALQASDRAMQEIQHRVKNHLGMIVGLIRVQARKSDVREEYDNLSRRVESLQLLYEELLKGSGGRESWVDLGAYLSRIGHAIAHLDGRSGIRVNVDSAALRTRIDSATRIGLIVSEVLTNALQHAFVGRESGTVSLRTWQDPTGHLVAEIADDGVGLPPDVDWPNAQSLGGRIVTGLIDGLEGRLEIRRRDDGTTVTLTVPPDRLSGK